MENDSEPVGLRAKAQQIRKAPKDICDTIEFPHIDDILPEKGILPSKDKCGTCNQPSKLCTCIKDGIPTGAKFDGDKNRWDLLPIEEIERIVEILTSGAKKYAPNNWQRVPDGTERYYAALLRHLVAWRKGEKNDPESGKSHLAHLGCCLVFLMWLDNNE